VTRQGDPIVDGERKAAELEVPRQAGMQARGAMLGGRRGSPPLGARGEWRSGRGATGRGDGGEREFDFRRRAGVALEKATQGPRGTIAVVTVEAKELGERSFELVIEGDAAIVRGREVFRVRRRGVFGTAFEWKS
jgi:hypothetical protein